MRSAATPAHTDEQASPSVSDRTPSAAGSVTSLSHTESL